MAVMRGRSSSTRRGVKALDTSVRSRVWSGGSAASMCSLSGARVSALRCRARGLGNLARVLDEARVAQHLHCVLVSAGHQPHRHLVVGADRAGPGALPAASARRGAEGWRASLAPRGHSDWGSCSRTLRGGREAGPSPAQALPGCSVRRTHGRVPPPHEDRHDSCQSRRPGPHRPPSLPRSHGLPAWRMSAAAFPPAGALGARLRGVSRIALNRDEVERGVALV